MHEPGAESDGAGSDGAEVWQRSSLEEGAGPAPAPRRSLLSLSLFALKCWGKVKC